MKNQTIIQNRYRLEKRIGHEAGGATGTAYLATDLQLQQKVVVKVLRPVFASDRDFIRKLRRSFEAIASVKHPAIVRYMRFIVSGDQIAVVSDYVDGLTLEDILKKHGPLKPEVARQHMLQLCSAMHLAHSYGLGHYDLTRRNVMISKEDELLLCDLGISRQMKDWLLHSPGARKSSEIDRAQLIEYLAPEQRVTKPIYDIGCDIYAAGILFHEMQTGSFPDLSTQARRSTHKPEERASDAEALKPSDELRPASGDYLVKKALSPKPWQRWESFIVMSYALEGKVQAKTRQPEPPASLMRPIKDKLLRKRMIGFALVGILILGAILGVAKLVSMIPRDISGPREALTEYLSEDAKQGKKAAPAKPKSPEPEPSVHFSYARDLIAQSELDEAEKEVQMALELKGDPAVGAELLRIIQRQRTIDSFLKKARRHTSDSELVEANVLLDQVLEMEPENLHVPDLRAAIDKMQRTADLLTSARDAFEKKFYTTPEGESAYYFAKKVLEEDPENQDAKAIITDIVRTYTEIGDAFFKAEEFSKAAFYYGKVLRIDKENAHASERARLSRQRQQEAQQATEVETATEAEPETLPAEPEPAPEDTAPRDAETG